MTDPVHAIPTEAIDAEALIRDRTVLEQGALHELEISILVHGLRQPIEVFELSEPRPPHTHGLISGLRRLTVWRRMGESGDERYRTIPAFVRAPKSVAEALTAVIEENEVRAAISPWERGFVIHAAWAAGLFETIEQAVNKLHPAADQTKRSRLRSLARLVEEFDGVLTAPERLSLRQALRLEAACRRGFGELMRTALEETFDKEPSRQWSLLVPILEEVEAAPPDEYQPPRPGVPERPRRLSRPRPGLTIRRERTYDGYSLHFTGRGADSFLMESVFDRIDRIFGKD